MASIFSFTETWIIVGTVAGVLVAIIILILILLCIRHIRHIRRKRHHKRFVVSIDHQFTGTVQKFYEDLLPPKVVNFLWTYYLSLHQKSGYVFYLFFNPRQNVMYDISLVQFSVHDSISNSISLLHHIWFELQQERLCKTDLSGLNLSVDMANSCSPSLCTVVRETFRKQTLYI